MASFSIEIKNLKFLSLVLLLPFFFTLDNISQVDAKYVPVKETPTMIYTDMNIERVFKGDFEPSSFAFLDSNRILVLDRDKGIVMIIQNGSLIDTPVLIVNVQQIVFADY